MKDNLSSVWLDLEASVPKFASKIQPMFEANKWTWANFPEVRVPKTEDIEATLYSLCWEAYREAKKHEDNRSCVGTGRLQVRFVKYAFGWTGTLELVPFCERV
jgi:hypothetical protein